jgi:chaperonin GroES
MTAQIKPLKGQCLLQILPGDYKTGSGLHLPDIAMLAARGLKQFPAKARVIAVGPWKKTKQGFCVLPDFQPGQTVIVSHYLGTKLTRDLGENYRLCRVDDVLAVLTEPEKTLIY